MKTATILVISLALLFSCNKKPTGPVMSGWEVLSIGSSVWLLKVDFVDSNYGWVIGKDTVICHTTDGGNTWISQPYPKYLGSYPNLNDIHFVDRQLGWAVGGGFDGLIYKTTDGGQNWFIHDTLKGIHVNCVIFTDSRHGWVCGGTPEISYFKTSDGGDNWIPINTGVYLRDFVDSSNGWAIGFGSIYKTSDGGLNWNLTYNLGFSGIDLDFVDLLHGWGLISQRVSEYEQWSWIIHTSDGGYYWEVQMDTFKYQIGNFILLPLKMLNQNVGWLGKYQSKVVSVLHTTNAGITWLDQPLPLVGDRPILDIDFINDKEGWAVGVGGLLLRTKNGGNPIR